MTSEASPLELPKGWEAWSQPRKDLLLSSLRREKFKLLYENDPVAWVHDAFKWEEGEGPKPYQEEALASLVDKGRLSIRGPHGPGKTTIAAWAILWFAETRDGDNWKVPTTASRWRQLQKFLWPEIHKWVRKHRWEVLGRDSFEETGELLDLSLKLDTGEAFAVASSDPSAIEGAHADRLLYVYDEAKTISDEMFEATEGAFSGAGEDTDKEAMGLTLSTPGEPVGPFYGMHRRDRKWSSWFPMSISLEEAIEAGQISRAWSEEKAAQWGSGSAVYQNRVEGEFATDVGQAVIPLVWVEDAIDRWKDLAVETIDGEWIIPEEVLPAFTNVTADVADEGDTGDQTILALRHQHVVTEFRRFPHGPDLMETTGNVIGVLRKHPGAYVVVDAIGIGSGPISRLREQNVRVVGFVGSESSGRTDESGELEYHNLRAEAWYGMRDRLDPNKPGPLPCLPPDDEMVGDLTAPKKKTTSSGRLLVESKEDIRKRLGRSTDVGDTVVMSFHSRWAPAESVSVVGQKIGRVTGSARNRTR